MPGCFFSRCTCSLSFQGVDVEGLRLTQPPLQRRFVVKVLREASNEGTLRAFRDADRFTTFKIFRRPGAL
jgi:hypothetical protein